MRWRSEYGRAVPQRRTLPRAQTARTRGVEGGAAPFEGACDRQSGGGVVTTYQVRSSTLAEAPTSGGPSPLPSDVARAQAPRALQPPPGPGVGAIGATEHAPACERCDQAQGFAPFEGACDRHPVKRKPRRRRLADRALAPACTASRVEEGLSPPIRFAPRLWSKRRRLELAPSLPSDTASAPAPDEAPPTTGDGHWRRGSVIPVASPPP